MPAQMVLHEGRDEIIAVVVPLLHSQIERDAGVAARGFEQRGLQLGFEEAVGSALIDEDLCDARTILDQRDRIRLAPGGTVGAEIAAERLLAPRNLRRRGDRREGGDAAIAAGIAQRETEGAVAAHRMTGNRLPGGIDGEMLLDQRWKLIRYVAEHAI